MRGVTTDHKHIVAIDNISTHTPHARRDDFTAVKNKKV